MLKSLLRPTRQAHTCIASYSGGGGRKIIVQGQNEETLFEKQTKSRKTEVWCSGTALA
jgi:peptidyl-tRNA hydrolase